MSWWPFLCRAIVGQQREQLTPEWTEFVSRTNYQQCRPDELVHCTIPGPHRNHHHQITRRTVQLHMGNRSSHAPTKTNRFQFWLATRPSHLILLWPQPVLKSLSVTLCRSLLLLITLRQRRQHNAMLVVCRPRRTVLSIIHPLAMSHGWSVWRWRKTHTRESRW